MSSSSQQLLKWATHPPDNVEECGIAIRLLCKELLSLRQDVDISRSNNSTRTMPSMPVPIPRQGHRYAPEGLPPFRRDEMQISASSNTSEESLTDKISSAVRANKRIKPDVRHYWSTKQYVR